MNLLVVGVVVAVCTPPGQASLSFRTAAPPGDQARLVVPTLTHTPVKPDPADSLPATDRSRQDVFALCARWFAGEDVPIGDQPRVAPAGSAAAVEPFEMYWEAMWLPPRTATADRWRVWLCADWWTEEVRPGSEHIRSRIDGLPGRRPWKPDGVRPQSFDDQRRFLADLVAGVTRGLPPLAASQEQWREWIRAAEPPPMRSGLVSLVVGISIRESNREEWDPALQDPWVKKWLATPPGPSWRTLTRGDKEPEWTVIHDEHGNPIGRKRATAGGIEFSF